MCSLHFSKPYNLKVKDISSFPGFKLVYGDISSSLQWFSQMDMLMSFIFSSTTPIHVSKHCYLPDQRGRQGDKLVINQLITIISPCPEKFMYLMQRLHMFNTYLQPVHMYIQKFTSLDLSFWEINKLYPTHSYDILLCLVSCNNKDTIYSVLGIINMPDSQNNEI